MTWIIEKIESKTWAIKNLTWVDISNSIDKIEKNLNIWDKYFDSFLDFFSAFWPKLLWAILVLWIWFKIVNFLNKIIKKAMDRSHIDPLLKTFLNSFLWIILKILIVLSAVSMLWVETTSFIALFTAAWVAIWMSLSGTLQNFAWWMIILAFKLYKIWDYISIWWNEWTVKSIHMFHTIIVTIDKKTIIIPNSQISNWMMINFSTEPVRRIDTDIEVAYETDIDFAKKVFKEVAEKNEKILKDEEKEYDIIVFINEIWQDGIKLTIRYYVEKKDLLEVKRAMKEEILKSCKENNINIPFPTMEIKMK